MNEPHLSIIIPAYNEVSRLPRTLDSLFSYLPKLERTYEILIVNDGSADGTKELVENIIKTHPEVRLISYSPNRGRGYAVKRGVLEAKGDIILETDADGSVADEAIGRFLRAFDSDSSLQAVFGSREMEGARIAERQPPLRVFLGYMFILLAKILFWMWNVSDFTLGFKMFRREAARDIFARQYNIYYLAEAEIIYVAEKRGFKWIQLPVTWVDNKDSRVNPFIETLRSLFGIVQVLVNSLVGKYK